MPNKGGESRIFGSKAFSRSKGTARAIFLQVGRTIYAACFPKSGTGCVAYRTPDEVGIGGIGGMGGKVLGACF